jgi:methyl-accepting chemotaxis protein
MAPDDKHDLISGTCSHLPKMSQIEQSIASLHTKMDALLSQYESGMISNEEDRQLVADDRRLVAQYGKASEDVLRLPARTRMWRPEGDRQGACPLV